MTSARRRITTWARWLLIPWSSFGLAAALVGAFAMPALLVASAGLFERSASDAVARRIVADRSPQASGLVIDVRGLLAADSVDALDATMNEQLSQIPGLAAPTSMLVTDSLPLSTVAAPGAEPQVVIGAGGRFFARAGAIESLSVVRSDPSINGIWISRRVADQTGLGPGSLVQAGGGGELTVAGVYADLWPQPPPYWSTVPPAFVPRFLDVFQAPNFELIVLDRDLLLSQRLPGSIRWDAPLAEPPTTFADLEALAGAYTALERRFTQNDAFSALLDDFSGADRPVPELDTALFAAVDAGRVIVAELDQPIAVTATGGIALGLLITAAGAVFAVRKRAVEFRLLAADGDAEWRFAARSVAQYAAPAVTGAIIGVIAGWLLIAGAGPSGDARLADVDAVRVVQVTVAGVLLASLITAGLASRVLDTTAGSVGRLRTTWLFLVIGLAIAGWVQVGSATRRAELDPIVVAFPLVGLLAGVGVTVVGLRWLLARVRRMGGRLPTALFLAWRRLTASESGALLLAGTIGVALGMVVFTTVFVDTLDTAARAKTATAVGSATQITVLGQIDVDPSLLPPESTVIQSQTTRLTPGTGQVRVVAIDPASFAAGVVWHRSFGGTADDLVQRLGRAGTDSGDLPAVLVAGRTVPRSGGLGTGSVFPYRVVGTVASAPLADDRLPTLVVRTDHFEALAAARHQDELDALPPGAPPPEAGEAARSPMFGYAKTLVSRTDAATVTAVLDGIGLRTRDLVTTSERLGAVDARATRWAFEYLRLLGGVAAFAAAGALFLYLAERRSGRELAGVMTTQMGMRSRTGVLAAVFELIGLVAIALVAGVVSALVTAGRVFPRFEPEPTIPPTIGLQRSPLLVGAIAGAAMVVVAIAAGWSQRSVGAARKASVLRDAT